MEQGRRAARDGKLSADTDGTTGRRRPHSIYKQVGYKYVPTIGYVMAKSGITLSDFTFTRPRQSTCVLYNTAVCPTS